MKVKLVSTSFFRNPNTDDEEELYIDGYVHYSEDYSYGEDADGKRGVYRMGVENVSDVMASDAYGETIELNDVEEELAKDLLTEKFFNE